MAPEPDAAVAQGAAKRLGVLIRGILGFNKAIPSISLLLDSGDRRVRLEAVRVLGTWSQGPDGAHDLAAVLQKDEDWQVRAAAAKALGAFGAMGLLSTAVGSDTLAGASVSAAILFAALIAAVLGDSHDLVREAAAEALGLYGSQVERRCSQALEAALRDDGSFLVRSAGARSLGRLAAAAAWEEQYTFESGAALADALKDNSVEVRWHAATALASMRCTAQADADTAEMKHVAAALAASLRGEESARVRQAAAVSLGALASLRSRSALAAALRADPLLEIREEAARSLGAVGRSAWAAGNAAEARACAAALAAALKEPDARVRATAISALGSLGVASQLHAGDLAAQLSSDNKDIARAVRNAFQEATASHGLTLVKAAFAPVNPGACEESAAQEQVRSEAAEVLSAWSSAIASQVAHIATKLHVKSLEVRSLAEGYLMALGPAASICLADEVVRSKAADYLPRMSTVRGLFACLAPGPSIPPDLACAVLSEWIYEPAVEALPVPGLELVKLQRPEEHLGINLQWAVLRSSWKSCFVVFRGSETALDWTENSYVSLRGIDVPTWGGVLLLHSGFWSTAEAEAGRLREAIEEAVEDRPFDTLILCGGSKGGANALATAVQWLVPRAGRAESTQLPCEELLVVTFGAPNIVGRGNEQQGSTRALQQLRHALSEKAPRSRAWSFSEDPVPALMSSQSGNVLSQYGKGHRRALQLFRWMMPQAYNKASTYFEQAVGVAATFEAVLPEAQLEPPPELRSRGRFDASIHPQRNYTEALCRRLLPAKSLPKVQRVR